MNRFTSMLLGACVALSLSAGRAPAQAPANQGRLQVFLDCPVYLCDFDFLRTEITFVDYVRERSAADVHVLVTTQNTGGGGTEYGVTLVGQRRFAGSQDTLRYDAPQANSQDQGG